MDFAQLIKYVIKHVTTLHVSGQRFSEYWALVEITVSRFPNVIKRIRTPFSNWLKRSVGSRAIIRGFFLSVNKNGVFERGPETLSRP